MFELTPVAVTEKLHVRGKVVLQEHSFQIPIGFDRNDPPLKWLHLKGPDAVIYIYVVLQPYLADP